MSYEKLTTFFQNKSVDIRDVEDHFALSNDKGVHQIDVRLMNRDLRLRVPVVVSHVEIHISYPR